MPRRPDLHLPRSCQSPERADQEQHYGPSRAEPARSGPRNGGSCRRAWPGGSTAASRSLAASRTAGPGTASFGDPERGDDVLLFAGPASRTWCVPRVSRAELVYAVTCIALFVVAALDGGDQVWPYITLTVALLPAGLFSLALLALVADGLPAVVGGGVLVVGVVIMAALN